MKSSIEILDAVADHLGATRFRDARIAEATGIKPGSISNIRAGRKFMANSDCKLAARVLGIEPAALITIVSAEREDDKDIKRSLLKLAQRGLAAAVVLALSAGMSAGYAPTAQASRACDVYYVK